MNNLVVCGLINKAMDLGGNELSVLKADLAFGLPKEDAVIETLSGFFNENIEKSKNPYSRYDASSKTTKYEIKSRRNCYLKYPTTIIPVDKTECINGDRLVFVFNFTDGLYYIEYDKDKFAKYEVKQVEAVRKGGIRTLKDHFFIPIQDLTEINI